MVYYPYFKATMLQYISMTIITTTTKTTSFLTLLSFYQWAKYIISWTGSTISLLFKAFWSTRLFVFTCFSLKHRFSTRVSLSFNSMNWKAVLLFTLIMMGLGRRLVSSIFSILATCEQKLSTKVRKKVWYWYVNISSCCFILEMQMQGLFKIVICSLNWICYVFIMNQ